MRNTNEQSLKQVIYELLEKYHLSEKIDETVLMEQWQELMGKMVAQHTKKIYLSKKKLYIVLNSSVLRNELAYTKSKIIEMLNQSFGREVIDEVILK